MFESPMSNGVFLHDFRRIFGETQFYFRLEKLNLTFSIIWGPLTATLLLFTFFPYFIGTTSLAFLIFFSAKPSTAWNSYHGKFLFLFFDSFLLFFSFFGRLLVPSAEKKLCQV